MAFSITRSVFFAALIAPQLLVSSSLLSAEASRAFVNTYSHGYSNAVDTNGARHHGKDYRGKLPWLNDTVKTVAPDYPYAERLYRHQGVGIIQLTLDLKTGSVVKATMMRSTGFKALDQCAVAAFRQWRWKPGKWAEVDLGVTFRIHDTSTPLPAGAIRLPPAR
jgi:TonB family protein